MPLLLHFISGAKDSLWFPHILTTMGRLSL